MAAAIIDGRALADELRADLRSRTAVLHGRGRAPRLVVVIVGEDGASLAYVRSLVGIGGKVGVEVRVDALRGDADEDAVRTRLQAVGADRNVHGVMLQQPLPRHLSIRAIADAIPPAKDVDAANPVNHGRLAFGEGSAFVPATPAAVMLLLARSPHAEPRGKEAVVIGRSSVVGLPVALLLIAAGATVTVTHTGTVDLAEHTRRADIIVAAAGRPGMLRGAMVRPGATVIDVGTTFVDDRVRGDVAYDEVAAVAGAITPVPGGVGPVTNVALMRNVVDAAERLS